MFTKSKKSAALMAVIFGIPMALIAVVVGQIRYANLPPEEQNPTWRTALPGSVPP